MQVACVHLTSAFSPHANAGDSTTIEFQRLRDAATAAIEAAKEMKRKQQEAAVQIERLAVRTRTPVSAATF